MHFHARALLIFAAFFSTLHAAPVPVRITPEGRMTRGGQPYFIKGAGGETRLEELKQSGANSFRTWGDGSLGTLLPQADRLGLTICAGIWLEPESSWFSYHKPEHCEKQAQRVREIVSRWKDAPALLCWGLGNEMEGNGKNDAYWQQLDRLAKLVHEIDPAHPACTVLAGFSADKADGLNKFAPSLDFVGINTYGGLPSLREQVGKLGWKRPWVVTEFGAQGPWERPKSSWGAAIEQTSSEKARSIREGYAKTIAPGKDCLGSYAFLWGQKQEGTATWFGLFTRKGERVASADVLQEIWSGKAPANRAPEVKQLTGPQKAVAPGEVFTARLAASDPENDPLAYRWEVMPEKAARDKNGQDQPLAPLPACTDGATTAEAKINAPKQPGNYRIFAYALDGKGHAATANVPFQVK